MKQSALRVYSSPPVQQCVLAFMRLSGRERHVSARYFRQPGFKGLQIGAGANRHQGWLHTNWFPIRPWGRKSVFLDATRRFPFADASFDCVFSEHMIEHVDHAGGSAMLRECFRVLRPGGTIRISTPDLDVFVRLLGQEISPGDRKLLDCVCRNFNASEEPVSGVTALNTQMRSWGHRFIYDEVTLRQSLEKAGFISITRHRVGESNAPTLRGVDNPERLPKDVLNRISVILEATKPDNSG